MLVVVFGLQSFSGASVNLPMPEVSAATGAEILKFAAQAVTIVSLVFGLLFTPIGRRLRAEFGLKPEDSRGSPARGIRW